MNAASLAANQKATKFFIDDDPSTITLYPQERQKMPSGGYKEVVGPPKAPQNVKLIFQTAKGDTDSTSDGSVRKQDVVIVGLHDADISEGDFFYWPFGSPQKWVVTGVHPDNGYEVKADAIAYGIGSDRDPH